MKKLLSAILVMVLMIGFPFSANAIYYDRAGNPIQPETRQQTQLTPKPKLPYGTIGLLHRQDLTEQVDYILEYECKVDAVNLYRGETLYTCNNGLRFWSQVNIDPSLITLISKNRKKVNDEFDDALYESVAISSSIMVN
jgi:hypothetical protein